MAPARSRPRSQTSSTSASARWPASARSPPTSCAFGRVSSRSSSPTRVAPDSASTAAAMSRWPCASSPSSRTRDTPFPARAQVLKAEFRQKQPQLSLIASDLPDTKQLRNLRRESRRSRHHALPARRRQKLRRAATRPQAPAQTRQRQPARCRQQHSAPCLLAHPARPISILSSARIRPHFPRRAPLRSPDPRLDLRRRWALA